MSDTKIADVVIGRIRGRFAELGINESMVAPLSVTDATGGDHTTATDELVLLMDDNTTLTVSDDSADAGQVFVVINADGSAATNGITVTAESDSTHNVNGSNQDVSLSVNNGVAVIACDNNGDIWTGVAG